MDSKHLPLLIFGSSGASKEIYYLIQQMNLKENAFLDVLGFVEKEEALVGNLVCGNKKVITSDNNIEQFINNYERIGMVIPLGNGNLREKIYLKIQQYNNVFFPNIIHPSVIWEKDIVNMGEGNIIAAGTIITCNFVLGNFNFININCTIGHDVKLGNFNTINPLSSISGDVKIGSGSIIGAGSTVLQGLNIQDNTTLGAGAVLTKDTKKGQVLVGVPAKELRG